MNVSAQIAEQDLLAAPHQARPEARDETDRAAVALPPRYHALDALRGVMMLLGLWLHAAVAYSREGGWPWKDGSSTAAFDWTVGLIHTFRMPVFYVMAGFFSALLVRRRGAREFAKNRALRILVPFVAGWTVLFPMVGALTIWASNFGQPGDLGKITEASRPGAVQSFLHPMHLWFLEYLVFFYLIVLAVRPLAVRRPVLVAKADRWFRAILASGLGAVVLALVSFPTLCLMRHGWLDDPGGFAPEPKIVLAYLVFFGTGWLLYRSADLLPMLRPRRVIVSNLVVGLVAWFLISVCFDISTHYQGIVSVLGRLGCVGCNALAMWFLVFGSIGAFLRFFDRPSPGMKYVADSSYWLYLVHMPVFLIVQIGLARTTWPAPAKVFALLSVSVPLLLASYHYLVRPTWLGLLLNGRRYPVRPAIVQSDLP